MRRARADGNHHTDALSAFNKPWQWRFESNGKNRGMSSLLPLTSANEDAGFVETTPSQARRAPPPARARGRRPRPPPAAAPSPAAAAAAALPLPGRLPRC